jgi:hypothetical protein
MCLVCADLVARGTDLIIVSSLAREWYRSWTEKLPYERALWICKHGRNIICSSLLHIEQSLCVLVWQIFNHSR